MIWLKKIILLVAVDRKPFKEWYQVNDKSNNIEKLDLKELTVKNL